MPPPTTTPVAAASGPRLAAALATLGCFGRPATDATADSAARPSSSYTASTPAAAALDWVCAVDDCRPFLTWLQAALSPTSSSALSADHSDRPSTAQEKEAFGALHPPAFGLEVLTETEADAYAELEELGLLPEASDAESFAAPSDLAEIEALT
ncbi:hypothetical protein HK405_001645 [Cladochytrium tenue]|nr:hypothetical protein HK405_001645 [Cladochytrium tenue]